MYRQKARHLKLLTEAQFFKAIADASGYIDEATAKRVYMGMLSVLYRELRTKGAIRFPALCDFHMVWAKPRKIFSWRMKEHIMKDWHHQLHIRPVKVVRQYFKEWEAANPGVILDPAEKLKRGEIEGI